MTIKILRSAKKDLKEGYHFYEFPKNGLGKYFLTTLFDEINSLKKSAGVHSIHFDHYHRLLSNKFPFAIFYRREKRKY